MELKKTRTELRPGGQIVTLLEALGVCHRRNANQRRQRHRQPWTGFWQRNEHQLHELLHDARRGYLKRMKELHPDKNGNVEQAKRLNELWVAVKKRFGTKGIRL